MIEIDSIKAMALAYGACEKVLSISSLKDAIALLMTPQGREFAVKSGFPTLQVCRDCSVFLDRIPEVLLDAPKSVINGQNLFVIGHTKVTALYSEPDKLHHIVAMHGAEVEVKAFNYAVVTVTSINATVRIINDGTAKVTVEQSEK